MLYFGETIPAGYTLQIQSWENDADDHSNQYFHGLTKAEIEQFKWVLPIFASCNDWKEPGAGNQEFDEVSESIGFEYAKLLRDGKINLEFADKYLGFNPDKVDLVFQESWEDEFDDMIGEWAVSNKGLMPIQKMLGYPVSFDDGFVRVFDCARVTFIGEEIYIPSLKFEKLL